MKIYVKDRKKPRGGRGELIIDVGGLTEYEAEDFIDEVKRRVTVKGPARRSDPCGDPPRGGGTGRRQVIDVNINVRD